MKLFAILLSLCVALTCSASMAENRARMKALKAEVHELVELQSQKISTAKPLLIIGHNVSRANSAGGVEFAACFQVTSPRPLKYVRFVLTAYNRVGDKVACSIRKTAETVASATGPFNAGYCSGRGNGWPNLWYNSDIAFSHLEKVEVDYMDGTKETIEGEALKAIQLRPDNNEFGKNLQQTRRVYIANNQLMIDDSGW